MQLLFLILHEPTTSCFIPLYFTNRSQTVSFNYSPGIHLIHSFFPLYFTNPFHTQYLSLIHQWFYAPLTPSHAQCLSLILHNRIFSIVSFPYTLHIYLPRFSFLILKISSSHFFPFSLWTYFINSCLPACLRDTSYAVSFPYASRTHLVHSLLYTLTHLIHSFLPLHFTNTFRSFLPLYLTNPHLKASFPDAHTLNTFVEKCSVIFFTHTDAGIRI